MAAGRFKKVRKRPACDCQTGYPVAIKKSSVSVPLAIVKRGYPVAIKKK
jgi:hypothetical protein